MSQKKPSKLSYQVLRDMLRIVSNVKDLVNVYIRGKSLRKGLYQR